MPTTKWDIVTRAQNRVQSYPSALGSAVVVNYVEDIASYVGNLTGTTPTLTDIGSEYHGILTNGTAALMIGYMNGTAVSYTAGRLSVSKSSQLNGQDLQMRTLLTLMNSEIESLGKPIRFEKTEPTT